MIRRFLDQLLLKGQGKIRQLIHRGERQRDMGQFFGVEPIRWQYLGEELIEPRQLMLTEGVTSEPLIPPPGFKAGTKHFGINNGGRGASANRPQA